MGVGLSLSNTLIGTCEIITFLIALFLHFMVTCVSQSIVGVIAPMATYPFLLHGIR